MIAGVDIEALVRHYGYVMVAAGTVMEGSTTVVSASFLAHSGYLNLGWVCAICGVVTTIESAVVYELARVHGWPAATNVTKVHRLQRVMGWVRKSDLGLMLVARFLVGFRTAITIACGIAGMSRVRFWWANVAGAIIWTGILAGVGYSGGHLLSVVVSDVRQHEWTALAVLGGVGIAIAIARGHHRDMMDLIRSLRNHN